MKKLFTLTATLLVLGASSAMAQSGLGLYWTDCSLGGTSVATFACDVNSGGHAIIASVIIPQTMPQFTACSAIIDLTFEDPALPAWWQTASGQCRANAITVSYDPAILNNFSQCPDIWAGSLNLSVFQPQQGTNVQGHAVNTLRLNSGAAIPAGQEIEVVADGTELTLCRININHTKSVGTGACAGCNIAACIVFNEAKAQQPAGQFSSTIVNEAPGLSRWLTWNGSPTNCPDGTPTRNRTWGAVKSLYR